MKEIIKEKDKEIEELEQQLKELPNKICNEIISKSYLHIENGIMRFEIPKEILIGIREKYTKEQKDERD